MNLNRRLELAVPRPPRAGLLAIYFTRKSLTAAHPCLALVLAALLLACGKSDSAPSKGSAAPVAPTLDPACDAKVVAFEPWLAGLLLEAKSYEIEMGVHPPYLDREPSPVEARIDGVEVRATQITAADVSAHGDTSLVEPAKLMQTLAELHAKRAGSDEQGAGSNDSLRVDVDRDATWGNVVAVVDAATKAGYTEAVFVFSATSKLAPPPKASAWTTSRADVENAEARLEALRNQCRPWGPSLTRAPDIGAALRACNCAADPDEIKLAMWTSTRWHQAHPRTGVVIALGKPGTTVARPRATPWSEAHKALLAAAPNVSFAVK